MLSSLDAGIGEMAGRLETRQVQTGNSLPFKLEIHSPIPFQVGNKDAENANCSLPYETKDDQQLYPHCYIYTAETGTGRAVM